MYGVKMGAISFFYLLMWPKTLHVIINSVLLTTHRNRWLWRNVFTSISIFTLRVIFKKMYTNALIFFSSWKIIKSCLNQNILKKTKNKTKTKAMSWKLARSFIFFQIITWGMFTKKDTSTFPNPYTFILLLVLFFLALISPLEERI